MNTQTIAALLNFFPLGGVFTTLTLKMQAPPRRKPRDTFSGVFPELWYGDSQQPKQRWLPLGPGQWYLLLFQALEGSLPFFCSDQLFRLLREDGNQQKQLPKGKGEEEEEAGLVKRKDKKLKPLSSASSPPVSEEVLQHPYFSGPNLTYLSVRTVVYSAFSCLSHPFSIVRTYYLISADLPADNGKSYALRTFEDDLYSRSYFSHWIVGVSEIWVGNMFLRLFARAKKSIMPAQLQQPSPSPAVLSSTRGKQLLPSKHACKESRLDEINELFSQNIVRTLAGFATRTLLFPLLTIRARLESEWAHIDIQHEGFRDCLVHILQEEGISGLYRGLPAHLISFGIHSLYIALLFGIAQGFIQADLWEDENDNNSP